MTLDLPPIGLGTSGNTDPEQCAESVANALEMGYRHVDTAQMYDNERAVGEGIARAEVPRGEITLATKVHQKNLAYDDAIHTAHESLDRLGVESVDLLYVHWPTRAYDPEDSLAAFDELYEAGVTENVAVSNFTPELLDEARELLSAPVVANQVELHPLLPQRELREYAVAHDLTLVAYCPVMRGEVEDVPELVEIAETHEATPAQVSLAWIAGLENVVAIPKATGEDHLEENLAAADLDLTDEERAMVDGIDEERRLIDPEEAAWNR